MENRKVKSSFWLNWRLWWESCSFFFFWEIWTYRQSFPSFLIIMHTCSLLIRFVLYLNRRLLLLCDVCGSEASLRNMKQSVRVRVSEVLPEKKRLWNRIPEQRLDPTHQELFSTLSVSRKSSRRSTDQGKQIVGYLVRDLKHPLFLD